MYPDYSTLNCVSVLQIYLMFWGWQFTEVISTGQTVEIQKCHWAGLTKTLVTPQNLYCLVLVDFMD